MGAVHVGIRHDDDFSIPELGEVEIFADGRAQSGDNWHQLFVAMGLVNPSLFDVQHFAPERVQSLSISSRVHSYAICIKSVASLQYKSVAAISVVAR